MFSAYAVRQAADDVQVRQPRAAPETEVNAPANHLQQHLGQVNPRQHRVDPLAQINQAPGLRDRLDPLDVQPPLGIHADRVVDRQLPCHCRFQLR